MSNNHCFRWCDTSYTYRKQIDINKDLIGGDLEDFPVCISIVADADLSDHCESEHGYDIAFYDCQSNLLDHEINYYSNGSLIVWIKIPEINAREDKPIHMYYGNASITDDPSTCETWSNGYVMVLHMDDDPNATHISDSACHRYTGTKTGDAGDVCDEASWGIHKAQLFDCTKHQVITFPSVTDSIITDGTVSLWWKNTGDNPYGTYGGLVRYRERFSLRFINDETLQTFWSSANDMPVGAGKDYTGLRQLSENVKYYSAITWKDDEYWFYPDDMTLFENWAISNKTHIGTIVQIGLYAATKCFCGYIDEVRISSVERSRAWLVTEYENQLDPTKYFSFGEEEEQGYQTCDTFVITSESYTLTFNSPDYNNKDGQLRNNIDVFNFVTGDVNALNKGLDSDNLVLSGKEFAETEFTSIINKFADMDSIMENHEEIVISSLGDCFDGTYVIENFNYVISYKDYMAFHWVMTLEKKPT